MYITLYTCIIGSRRRRHSSSSSVEEEKFDRSDRKRERRKDREKNNDKYMDRGGERDRERGSGEKEEDPGEVVTVTPSSSGDAISLNVEDTK